MSEPAEHFIVKYLQSLVPTSPGRRPKPKLVDRGQAEPTTNRSTVMHLEKQNQNRLVQSYRRHVRRTGEAPSDYRELEDRRAIAFERTLHSSERRRMNDLRSMGKKSRMDCLKMSTKNKTKKVIIVHLWTGQTHCAKTKIRSTSSEIIATTQNRGQFRFLLECPSRRVSRSEDRRKEAVRRLNVYTIPGISRRSIG